MRALRTVIVIFTISIVSCGVDIKINNIDAKKEYQDDAYLQIVGTSHICSIIAISGQGIGDSSLVAFTSDIAWREAVGEKVKQGDNFSLPRSPFIIPDINRNVRINNK